MTDAAFCKHLKVDVSSYSKFLISWQEQHQSSKLNISWLPEGIDLASLLREGT